jgi:hypothetical protein
MGPRLVRLVFLLSLLLSQFIRAPTASAQLSSNEVVHFAAQCRAVAGFLCQPISSTTDVERLIANGKWAPTWLHVHVLEVQTESSTFLLDTNSATGIFFYSRSGYPQGRGHLVCPPPTPKQIRQYLCPNINFTDAHITSQRGQHSYSWMRTERGILIEAQSLGVKIDDHDGSCLGYQNSVRPKPIAVRIPEHFDVARWTAKVKSYVHLRWWWLAWELRASPFRFRPDLNEKSSGFVYTMDGLLAYRFRFHVSDLRPRPDGSYTDVGELRIDVDVGKERIIHPPKYD